ncbi:EAL domain-containing protein [Anaerorhabdus sp.]|uniref:EAL domain-containing protein n=1 Tax=Anaerorhabdus sp. TaxID=1872524 RepID=UPI002FC7C967
MNEGLGNSFYVSVEEFNSIVKDKIESSVKEGKPFSVATLDLDHFSYINDLLGYDVGDAVLSCLTNHFSKCLSEGELFTRIHSDVYAFSLNFTTYELAKKSFDKLTNWSTLLVDILPSHYNLTASGGIIEVNYVAPLSALLDKANYARKKAKNSINSNFRYYDEKMKAELEWQKVVTLSVDAAFENNEFEMYLQPKILIRNNQIVGAEALARWNSAEYGMLVPDRFVPIMEQNGLICQLDFFMLREASKFIKASEEMGIKPIPISINFSKSHLTNDTLVEDIFKIVNDMGVATSLIEIEFTESLSVEKFERLIEIVTDLKLLGFKVSLDDFGSAYSSLNCLKELPIDIIKIDKGFLNSSSDTDKGKLIISKTVELIKSLRMLSVMEGIETQEQVDFLRKLSCDFGQGFFYAKPMKTLDFIKYIKEGNLVDDLQKCIDQQLNETTTQDNYEIPKEFQMDNWELFTLGKNIDMGLMKGYLDGDATIQYINDKALEYLGYTRKEFREIFKNSIIAFTHPNDAELVQKNAEELVKTGKPIQFQTRAIRKDGKTIVLQGRLSCVMDDRRRPIGIYAFQDVTEELERTEKLKQSLESKINELEKTVERERSIREELRLSEERYRAVVEQSDDIMFDWDFEEDTIYFSSKYAEQFGYDPILENVTINQMIRKNLHPDDLDAFESWIKKTYKQNHESISQFRFIDINGNYIWLSSRSTAISDDKGKVVRAVGVFSNITKLKREIDALTFKSQRDSLTELLNKEETHHQIDEFIRMNPNSKGTIFIMDIDDFKGINDNLGHQLGDNVLREFCSKIEAFFPKNSIIGRIGGDEFAAFVKNVDQSVAIQKAELLIQSIRLTYYGSASKYNISGSVGIASYPEHGKNFEELYHVADIALYESKRNGKDQFTVYQEHMTGSLRNVGTPVDWSESFLDAYFKDDFPFEIFEMLYETKDINASVQMILEQLGKRFKVDRVYIFQNEDEEGTRVSNTHEWCAPGITSEMMSLQNLNYNELGEYLNLYTKEGVYCCPDMRNTIKEVRDICEPRGIKALLHCAIYDEGKMLGFIGYDMYSYHNWSGEEIAILGYISRILTVFLIKFSTSKELEAQSRNYMEMLDNLNGYVYVIDPKTHKILYMNNAVKKLSMKGDSTCYSMAFGLDRPCENCPVKKLTDTIHFSTTEIYSEILDTWVNSAASKLKWSNNQEAVLICCTDISQYKK